MRKVKANVYVANKSAHDFSDAKRYGKLVFVTSGRLNRFNVNDMHRRASEAMEKSQPGDYIVPCSLNVLNSVVCSTFVAKHGRLNLLLFKEGGYIERNIVFGD